MMRDSSVSVMATTATAASPSVTPGSPAASASASSSSTTASTSPSSSSASPLDSTQSEKSQVVPRLVNNSLDQSPSSAAAKARTFKRANSTVSMSERNKLRSRLDSFNYQSTSPSSSNSNSPHKNPREYSSQDDQAAAKLDSRHYSASSITHMDSNKNYISPLAPSLDYFWSSKTLHKLYPIKMIDNSQLKSIMNWHYSNPLPECESIFPWLHGIHHSNQNQRDFLNSLINFTSVDKDNFEAFNNSGKIPSTNRCLMPVRSNFIESSGKRIVRNSAVLKGSVNSAEILCSLDVSKQDLLILLNGFLKDLKIHELNKDDFEQVLSTLFHDCEELGLLPIFKNLDPIKGVSLRNFHIQVSKLSQISDFIVYCFNDTHLHNDPTTQSTCQCASVARLLYFAQLKHAIDYPELIESMYSTLILKDKDLDFFKKSESNRRLLAIDKIDEQDTIKPQGKFCSLYDYESFNNWDTNYLFREKLEISRMSTATPVMDNVWFGNTTDFEVLKLKGPKPNPRISSNPNFPLYVDPSFSTVGVTREILENDDDEALITPASADWKIFVNCCESSNFPNLKLLNYLLGSEELRTEKSYLSFPPSGSIGIGDCDDDDLTSLLNTCKLLYVASSESRPSLIYCSDGYTESSLLGVCYAIYSTGQPLTKVVIDLHAKHGRPFFLFPTDVQLIGKIEKMLIAYSPKNLRSFSPSTLDILEPQFIYEQLYSMREQNWLTRLGGSMPSRILPHLYLGSLHHASSPFLLNELGITRIVSVGEKLTWENEDKLHRTAINNNISLVEGIPGIPNGKLMCVTNIQDDGIDTLTHNLRDILEFVNEAYEEGEKVLVHCRVGVSRSATVCIAEVMRRLKINLIRAYIFVRVRRLNVIIQPNLRFMYELVKWEESERLEISKRRLLEAKASITNSPVDSTRGSLSAVELSKRLSGSASSLSSAVSDPVIESSTIPFLENTGSPIRLASNALDQVIEDESDDEGANELENNYWLRDVDWHILCREIDTLNKAYIGVK